MSYISQNLKPIKINDFLATHSKYTNLRFIIASAIHESGGSSMRRNGSPTKPSSSFEGCELWGKVKFSDREYILVGHKCFMTLIDNDVSSIYVHPDFRRKGYGSDFMKKEFDVGKPIIVDTWVDAFKTIADENPSMENFKR